MGFELPRNMQALSNIHWFSELLSDRHEKLACAKPRHMPPVEPSLFNKLKRRMTDTNYEAIAPSDEPAPKRIKTRATVVTPTRHLEKPQLGLESTIKAPAFENTHAPVALLDQETQVPATISADLKVVNSERSVKLRQKVEAQINLEILLKHQELRLIEQELGKCQIALEQLRRCHIIPFSGNEGSPLTADQVTTGTGPALQAEPGFSQPPHPAPWGVVDGPYAQHYAKWLIPDPQFDATPIEATRRSLGGKSASVETRAMRGSIAERGVPTANRTHRASLASKQQPMMYAPGRQALLLIKHPLTGDMVKLVCKYCGKNNINSVQGFLNHCRIAHEKNYESHGAAAIDCGVPLDGTENMVVPVTNEPTPSVVSNGRPLVHSLIMGDRVPRRTSASSSAPSTPLSPVSASPIRQFSAHSRPLRASPLAQTFVAESFVGTAQTPCLSRLFQLRGVGVDLDKEVTAARVRVDLDQVESLEDPDDSETEGPQARPQAEPSIRFVEPVRPVDATSNSRSYSTNSLLSRNTATPSVAASVRSMPPRDSLSRTSVDEDLNLSPQTMDTNPGLMSDNDDEEERDYDMDVDAESDHAGQNFRVRVHEYDVEADMDEVMQDVHGHGEGSAENHKLASTSGTFGAKPIAKRKRGRPSKAGANRKGGN